jgi:hypothetical protein
MVALARNSARQENRLSPKPSEKLFVRDPREVLFLKAQVQRVLALADKSARGIPLKEEDDFAFMTAQFLYKQMQHAQSVLSLIPRRDAGSVARTMIEGLYQLLWTSQAAEERAQRWRSFSIIEDWRRIQRQLKEDVAVPEAVISRIEAALKEFGDSHRVKKPKPNSPDPYHQNWRGGTRLSHMADSLGRELYDEPYAELSDWEHWGVRGIGDSISRKDGHITINPDSDRIADWSLLAALQCLLQTLEVADAHFLLGITENIQAIYDEFSATINSFYGGSLRPLDPLR